MIHIPLLKERLANNPYIKIMDAFNARRTISPLTTLHQRLRAKIKSLTSIANSNGDVIERRKPKPKGPKRWGRLGISTCFHTHPPHRPPADEGAIGSKLPISFFFFIKYYYQPLYTVKIRFLKPSNINDSNQENSVQCLL